MVEMGVTFLVYSLCGLWREINVRL